VPVEINQSVPGWGRVRDALGEIRACHTDIENYLQSANAEFDQWREMLVARQRLVEQQDAERQQAAMTQQAAAQRENQESAVRSCEEQFAAWQKEIERQRGELQMSQAATMEQLARLGELAAAVTSGQKDLAGHGREWAQKCEALSALSDALAAAQPHANPSPELQQQFAELKEALAALPKALSAAQPPASLSPELQQQFAELKEALATLPKTLAADQPPASNFPELQQQSAELKEALMALPKMLAAAQPHASPSPELQQQFAELKAALANLPKTLAAAQPPASSSPELRQQYAELKQERALLESELENVRNRAAELTESLNEQKLAAAERQSHGDEELRHMRLLLETIARRQLEAERLAAKYQAAASGSSPAADPVLGSVLAQFELIEKDCARRREAY
jgi:chromosome segregation ATPase